MKKPVSIQLSNFYSSGSLDPATHKTRTTYRRERYRSLASACTIAAVLGAGSVHAADDDNDGIDNLVEGQFNDGTALPLFTNSGFESPSIGSGFQIEDINNVPGWLTDSDCDCAEIWFDGFRGVNSFGGSQFAELNSVSASDLHQQITVPSDRFTVSYSIAHRGRNSIDTMEIYIGTDESSKVLILSLIHI